MFFCFSVWHYYVDRWGGCIDIGAPAGGYSPHLALHTEHDAHEYERQIVACVHVHNLTIDEPQLAHIDVHEAYAFSVAVHSCKTVVFTALHCVSSTDVAIIAMETYGTVCLCPRFVKIRFILGWCFYGFFFDFLCGFSKGFFVFFLFFVGFLRGFFWVFSSGFFGFFFWGFFWVFFGYFV